MDKDTKQMENRKKKRLGWLAFCFVTFHVGCILISTFPLQSRFTVFKKIANAYAKPLFQHNWNMFAPCPLTDNKISFRINYASDTSNLIIPSALNGPAHLMYRGSYHGSLIVGEYNMLYWVKSDIERIGLVADQEVSSKKQMEFKKNGTNYSRGYFMLKNYLKGYANNLSCEPPTSFDVYCQYYNVEVNRMDTYYFKQLR